jgi:putative transposase
LEAVKARVAEVQAAEADRGDERRTLETVLSWRTVYRWLKDYRRGGDVRALIPATDQRGGKGQSRLQPEVSALIDAVIRDYYHKAEQVTIKDLLYLVAAAIEDENKLRPASDRLPMPGESTLQRRVDALDVRERFAARHGAKAARREFAQVGKTDYPQKPLERVEIDNTPIDLIVVDDTDFLPLGRLNLTKALDGATRYPLGYYLGFEPPSYYTVMECLHHAIWPKPDIRERYGTEHPWSAYGIPSLLVVDNGKEFIGQDLSDACLQLGITLENAPLQTPEFKAAIERHFGTCNSLFHALPGTTFSNIFQRGDYVSERQACMTLSELDQTLHLFLMDLYAERFHKGLQAIPARRWEAAIQEGFSPRLPASAQELSILLGRVAHRTLHRYGVEFENLRYNCAELATLRYRLKGEPAKIKYHPGDLSKVYVYDPFNQVYLTAPALAEEYTAQLSLWKHRIICQFVRREQDRVDLAALGRARRKIQEVVDAALSRKPRRGGRKLGRWQTGGQPPSLASGTPAATPLPAVAAPTGPPPADTDDILLGTVEAEEEWGITYDLPARTRSRSDTLRVATEMEK